MKTRQVVRGLGTILPAALLLLAAAPVAAQTSTGTVRGYVTGRDGQPLAGVEVVARNLETGVQRSTTTRADGAYVLPGLPPAPYELTARQIGRAPDTRRIRVQIGATALIDFALEERAVQLEEVQVTARARPVVETRTSEVATNVTQEQIDNLPSSDRNFLDLALLAPGATLSGCAPGPLGCANGSRTSDTRRTVAFGAQGAEQINVFIDGASYKNDILKGGVAGQDASRGNPFPRNAVREFRVITQNYKAEYQKASSGIITATTKSGSNVWEGQAFYSYVAKGLVALDSFQLVDKRNNPTSFQKPDYSRNLVGLSVGGPLIRDRLHLFGSYEGNYQNRTNRVNIATPAGFPALDTVNFAQYNGTFPSDFRQTMVFGKLSYAVNNNSSLEASLNVREENDVRDFGGATSFLSSTRFNNNVTTGVAKYNIFKGSWLNEATASYQRYHYNPVPNSPGTVNRIYFGAAGGAQIGSNISVQDFRQRRISLRDDLTYSGFEAAGSHVLKGGVSFDFANYDIEKRNSENPRFVYEEWHNSYEIPEHVEFQTGDPNFTSSNTQIGAYIQDDWSPTPRLTLNLGVRWDYESGMLNYDYVTPQAVVDSLTKYQSMLIGIPLDPDRYFTDGDDRPRYLGAFQPRAGLSYQLDRNGRTTIFGGWGIFIDRTLFDQAIEEKFALQHPSYRILFREPGNTDPNRIDWNDSYLSSPTAVLQLIQNNAGLQRPEVKLLPNDLRPPRSQQFSAGVRQLIGDFAVSAAYTGVRSKNVFTFYFANMNFTCPERSFGVAGCFVENRIPGYSTILFATNDGKTWYDALQIQVDRPYQYTGDFAWGAGLAFSLSKRQTEGFNDDFSFPNPVDYPKQVRNDERARVVANWVTDLPWVWGIQFSGLLTWGTGAKLDVGDRFGGTTNPLVPGGFDPENYRNLDLRLKKTLPQFGRTRIGVTLDLFNALNAQNLGCYQALFNPNDANFGKAGCVIADPRRLQIGGDVTF